MRPKPVPIWLISWRLLKLYRRRGRIKSASLFFLCQRTWFRMRTRRLVSRDTKNNKSHSPYKKKNRKSARRKPRVPPSKQTIWFATFPFLSARGPRSLRTEQFKNNSTELMQASQQILQHVSTVWEWLGEFFSEQFRLFVLHGKIAVFDAEGATVLLSLSRVVTARSMSSSVAAHFFF